MGIFLFILGAAVSAVVTYFIIWLAVRNAIIDARKEDNLSENVRQRKIIKQAIVEAFEEMEKKKNEN